MLTVLLACAPAPAPAPAPVQPPAPPPAVAAAARIGSTHCVAGERVAFSCPTKGDKVLSVCAGPDANALQYRYGPLGAPELVYPPTPSAAAFALGDVQYMRAEGTVLRFVNAGVKYEVTSQLGGGDGPSPEDGEANNFQGVYVYAARGKVLPIACVGPAEDGLAALAQSGAVPPL